MSNKGFRTFIVALAAALLTLSACRPAVGQGDAAAGQSEAKKKEEKKDDKKDGKKEATPEGKPVLGCSCCG